MTWKLRRPSWRLVAAGTLVLALATLCTAALVAPGLTTRAYLAALVLALLIAVLAGRKLRRLVLPLLGEVLPPIRWLIQYPRRHLELTEVVQGMDRTLKDLRQDSLNPEDLEALSEIPPRDKRDDVGFCCEQFAEKLCGKRLPMAIVFELLYRDSLGQETAGLWRQTKDEQRCKLARILAASERLPAVGAGREMEDLVAWVLDRLPDEFSSKLVFSEIGSLHRLWLHLSGYAEFLRGVGIEALPGLTFLKQSVDRELSRGLVTPEYDRVAEAVLLSASSDWVGKWRTAGGLKQPDSDSLALLGLGIFTAEFAPVGIPLLPALGRRVAGERRTLGMLLAYLWRRSRPLGGGGASPSLGELARHWSTWLVAAEAEMGAGVRHELFMVLRSELMGGVWPTWLPIQRTIAEIVQMAERNSGQLETLVAAATKDKAWRLDMQELFDRAGKTHEKILYLAPEAIVEKVTSAVEDKLRALTPPAQATGVPPTAQDLKKRLDCFAGQFRPETRLMGFLDSYARVFDTLALFRERAEDLTRELERLSSGLLAEAGGGSAYIITFDQLKGGLADLIDSLAEKYGFQHYTRYSRIGVLRPGEKFEAFYRRFEADLEEQLVDKFDAPEECQQIAITVQQISLLHSHDFATDAEATLKAKMPKGAAYTKVFRKRPWSAAFASPAAATKAGRAGGPLRIGSIIPPPTAGPVALSSGTPP
jgi:hypothetical protein